MRIPFVKMSGAGNDFVLIDTRTARYPVAWPDFARRACARRMGIGADGLLIVKTGNDTPYAMEYYNADGSTGSMCGNGGRCAAAYLMNQTNARTVSFFAVDFLYRADREGHLVRLGMKPIELIDSRKQIKIFDQSINYLYCNSGSPHVIIQYRDLPKEWRDEIVAEGLSRIGGAIRRHEAFAPGGVNVNFIEPTTDGRLSMRTYERGVEDETLACGTGAVACSVVASHLGLFSSPVTVLTRSGEELTVYFSQDSGRFTGIQLEGSARTVYEGSIEYA
ncbi:MAG TPA: diaminopimelate epimerase [Bacteroidota bacterium]|nr:diaminopimelate epimerase [Bacteroidota bacterium]